MLYSIMHMKQQWKVRKLKDPANGLKALQILSRKAGVYGMVGGQVVDVELTGKPISEEQLDFIYRYKTSALLELL